MYRERKKSSFKFQFVLNFLFNGNLFDVVIIKFECFSIELNYFWLKGNDGWVSFGGL